MTTTASHAAPRRARAATVLLASLATLGVLVSSAATLAAVRFAGAACAVAPTAHQVGSGQRALLAVVVAALLPWVVAASRTGPHSRARRVLLALAAVCCAPPVVALVVGLGHGFWRAGLCG